MDRPNLKIKNIDKRKKKEIIAKAEKKAMKKYMHGYNCAESVFETTIEILKTEFNYETDLPKYIVKLATGFGEGVGKHGSMCGAISGGTMALSLLYGYDRPINATKNGRIGDKGIYKIFNQLPDRFIKEFGSTECYEITEKFYKTYNKAHIMHCKKITSKTAGLVIEIIIEEQTKGIESLEFNRTI